MERASSGNSRHQEKYFLFEDFPECSVEQSLDNLSAIVVAPGTVVGWALDASAVFVAWDSSSDSAPSLAVGIHPVAVEHILAGRGFAAGIVAAVVVGTAAVAAGDRNLVAGPADSSLVVDIDSGVACSRAASVVAGTVAAPAVVGVAADGTAAVAGAVAVLAPRANALEASLNSL